MTEDEPVKTVQEFRWGRLLVSLFILFLLIAGFTPVILVIVDAWWMAVFNHVLIRELTPPRAFAAVASLGASALAVVIAKVLE